MTTYKTLRQANQARQAEWAQGEHFGPAFRAAELAGEVGELRDAFGTRQISDVIDELADNFICLDLALLTSGHGPLEFSVSEPETVDQELIALNDTTAWMSSEFLSATVLTAADIHLSVYTNRVLSACNQMKKLEREILGVVGSPHDAASLHASLQAASNVLMLFAEALGFTRGQVLTLINWKFNETSENLGLSTRLDFGAPSVEDMDNAKAHARLQELADTLSMDPDYLDYANIIRGQLDLKEDVDASTLIHCLLDVIEDREEEAEQDIIAAEEQGQAERDKLMDIVVMSGSLIEVLTGMPMPPGLRMLAKEHPIASTILRDRSPMGPSLAQTSVDLLRALGIDAL